MEIRVCSIVSPHLLDALTVSADPETRKLALNTLTHTSHIRAKRKHHFHGKRINLHQPDQPPVLQGIVPDQILEHGVTSDQAHASTRQLARNTLDIKQKLQNDVQSTPNTSKVTSNSKLRSQIYDVQNAVQLNGKIDQTYKLLPGKLVRSEGDEPIADEHANQAYNDCAIVLDFYQQAFGYTFLDDLDTPVISSIHFENGYQNAQ
jgi:Zn-dependent metalloprotease